MTDVSERVAAIIAAAEQTAEGLRKEAEERARERIAEADRAAEHRIRAAEDQAAEIRDAAEARAHEIVREAREQHRELLARADATAADVVKRGEDLSDALAQLGASLQTNARRVLQDVRHAHFQLRAPIVHASAEEPGDGLAQPAEEELGIPRFLRRR